MQTPDIYFLLTNGAECYCNLLLLLKTNSCHSLLPLNTNSRRLFIFLHYYVDNTESLSTCRIFSKLPFCRQFCRKKGLSTTYYDYSHTPRPCRHLVTASLCFRGLFFWDALYTRNRDSERSMINATILERRFERRLQTRFDYGYWNVILLLEKVINAPPEKTEPWNNGQNVWHVLLLSHLFHEVWLIYAFEWYINEIHPRLHWAVLFSKLNVKSHFVPLSGILHVHV